MEPSPEELVTPEEWSDLEVPPAPEEHPAPPQPTNPMNVGFALVVAFAIGLALGFFGRPQIISDVPIQVVVTVVPENNDEAVAQAPASNSQPVNGANPDQDHSAATMSEANSASTQPEQASASGQATPTIMDFVMADARHIDGNLDAPVTIIEFSDFK